MRGGQQFMKILRFALPVAVCAIAVAQKPAAPTPEPSDEDVKIKTSVTNIVAPVLVTDRQGNIVDGLQPAQFHLWDNGKEQNIQVDVTYDPISLMIALECSGRVESILK
jgi:hypothetical protein